MAPCQVAASANHGHPYTMMTQQCTIVSRSRGPLLMAYKRPCDSHISTGPNRPLRIAPVPRTLSVDIATRSMSPSNGTILGPGCRSTIPWCSRLGVRPHLAETLVARQVIRLVGTEETLAWTQEGANLVIKLPDSLVESYAYALKITPAWAR